VSLKNERILDTAIGTQPGATQDRRGHARKVTRYRFDDFGVGWDPNDPSEGTNVRALKNTVSDGRKSTDGNGLLLIGFAVANP
jgi:hypothetical protein